MARAYVWTRLHFRVFSQWQSIVQYSTYSIEGSSWGWGLVYRCRLHYVLDLTTWPLPFLPFCRFILPFQMQSQGPWLQQTASFVTRGSRESHNYPNTKTHAWVKPEQVSPSCENTECGVHVFCMHGLLYVSIWHCQIAAMYWRTVSTFCYGKFLWKANQMKRRKPNYPQYYWSGQ